MKKFSKRILVTLGVTLLMATGMAQAAEFPSKPIDIIVPYKAGGTTDVMARILAKNIQEQLGQPIVVKNRSGGGGSIGASFMKNQPADGYTLLVGASEISTWIPLTKEVDYVFEDLRYIAAVTEFQNALIANVDKPYNDLAGMIKYAKANPGLKVAHIGAISELMLKTLAEREGLDLRMITASGGSEVVQLLLSGRIDVGYSGGVHSSYPGKFEILASLNKGRLAEAPNKLSFAESGYDLAIPAHVVFMMRAGVPDGRAKILEEAILEATKDPDFIKIVEDRMKAPRMAVSAEEITGIIAQSQTTLKKLVN
jgi:tripartite-type tricarboxylate transporter receptor subunit TctC